MINLKYIYHVFLASSYFIKLKTKREAPFKVITLTGSWKVILQIGFEAWIKHKISRIKPLNSKPSKSAIGGDILII